MHTLLAYWRKLLEGYSLRKIKQRYEAEGIPTPADKRYWSQTFIRGVVKDDVYRPHSFKEIKALVTPEVAAQLDPDKSYGIWWFNRKRHTFEQVVKNTPEGKVYRKKKKAVDKPRNEWIAVPVPDAGIPRELVDAARGVIRDNLRPSSAAHRFWELSGGIFYCGSCGRQMVQHSATGGRNRPGKYFYYRCLYRWHNGKEAYPNRKSRRADKTEAQVWTLVSGLLKDPERLRTDLDKMIELERNSMRGDPQREQKAWLDKLAEIDRKRTRYQEMAADGLISFNELRARLAELDDTRRIVERELGALRDYEERVAKLEVERDTLLDSLMNVAPDALDSLTVEERYRVYKILN